MTPTASSKSLIYNIPVLESLLKRPESRAVHIPVEGLEQDQLGAFMELAETPADRKNEARRRARRKAFTPGPCEIHAETPPPTGEKR
jgi:hypothetical protein